MNRRTLIREKQITCPKCSTKMESGSFFIGATLAGFLGFGFSFKHLFFSNKLGEKIIAVDNDAIKRGYHCNCCDLYIIE